MDAGAARETATAVRTTLATPALRTALVTAVAGALLLLAIVVVGFLVPYLLVAGT